MDRYKVFPSGEMGMHPAGNWTPYADAQATVEALQAQLPAEMQECTILFKECEKGHGRLTATNWIDHGCQTCAMEALQRERDQWKEVFERSCDDTAHLKAALDAERERSKKQAEEAMVVFSKLSQLQALVRALPVVRIDLNGAYHDTLLARPEDEAVKELLRYRATLDATTPAPRQRQVHSCEIPGCVSCANPEEGGNGE